MRQLLNEITVKQLDGRFGGFHDSKLVSINLDLLQNYLETKATIVIEAPDLPASKAYTYSMVKVKFEIIGLSKYIIKQIEDFQLVLIDKIDIGFFYEMIYMDFISQYDDERDEETYSLESKYIVNQVLFVGNKCYWTVLDDK